MPLTFREDLHQRLKNPKAAITYLETALEDGDTKLFLEALKDVAEAQGGMTRISKKARLDRAGLYRILSRHGNPTYKNLRTIMEAIGYRFKIEKVAA